MCLVFFSVLLVVARFAAFAAAHHDTNLSTIVDCGELNTTLCLDEIILLDCKIAHSYLEWAVPAKCTNSHELDFLARTDEVGKVKTCEAFNATLVSKTGPSGEQRLSSSLIFTVQLEYNNTNITCYDAHDGDAQTCTITIAGTPSKPLNMTAHKLSQTTMEINWNPVVSSGVPISYDVTVSPPPHGGICNDGNCTANGTELILSGLECISYNITIQARNCVGQSCLFNLSTTSELPSKVLKLVDKEGAIQWNPPLQNNDGEEKIINYKVSIAGQSWNVTKTSFNYTRFLNLSNGEYNISVQAVNCHGEGDPAFIKVNSDTLSILIIVGIISSVLFMGFVLSCVVLYILFRIKFCKCDRKQAVYLNSDNTTVHASEY